MARVITRHLDALCTAYGLDLVRHAVEQLDGVLLLDGGGYAVRGSHIRADRGILAITGPAPVVQTLEETIWQQVQHLAGCIDAAANAGLAALPLIYTPAPPDAVADAISQFVAAMGAANNLIGPVLDRVEADTAARQGEATARWYRAMIYGLWSAFLVGVLLTDPAQIEIPQAMQDEPPIRISIPGVQKPPAA